MIRLLALTCALGLLAFGAIGQSPAPSKPPDLALRLHAIVFPEIDYRGKKLSEVVAELNLRSKEFDPGKAGVRIEVAPSPSNADPAVTLQLERPSLHMVLAEVARVTKHELYFTETAAVLAPPAEGGLELVIPSVTLKNATLPQAIQELNAKAKAADPRKLGFPMRVTPAAAIAAQNGRITLEMKNATLGNLLLAVVKGLTPPAPLVYRADNTQATISRTGEPDPLFVAGGVLMQRAARIILPEVSFKDTKLIDAFAAINEQAKALDPQKTGIPIELSAGAKALQLRITLSLRSVRLSEALIFMANLAKLSCGVRDGKLVFFVPGEK
jgi:hypothetical protein